MALTAERLSDETRAEFHALFQQQSLFTNAAKLRLIAAAKIPATTPAGIYAKAMAVRLFKSGAPKLAESLAEDLVGLKTLRDLLWVGQGSDR